MLHVPEEDVEDAEGEAEAGGEEGEGHDERQHHRDEGQHDVADDEKENGQQGEFEQERDDPRPHLRHDQELPGEVRLPDETGVADHGSEGAEDAVGEEVPREEAAQEEQGEAGEATRIALWRRRPEEHPEDDGEDDHRAQRVEQ